MFVKHKKAQRAHRKGAAAVEFAVLLPVLFSILFGLWEVGRIVEVENVMYNSVREGSRDASMGQVNLAAVASNVLIYLQSAEPTAFGSGHTTTMKSPVITLASNTYGYTCWDSTDNRELFTITFQDTTNTSVTDPTGMSQLDQYTLTVSAPYSSFGWLSVAEITGVTRIYASLNWVSMVDSPFTINPYLSAQ